MDLVRPKPPTLPATKNDLLAQRKIQAQPTLNDFVDQIHLALWEDPQYQAYLEAVWPEDAVEGSTIADDFEAARMIREYAKEHEIALVSSKKLATIVKALGVVTRRYGMSRKERRNMVHGEVVQNGGDE